MSTAAPATYASGHHASVLAAHATRTISDSATYALSTLDELATARPALRILDVGCGPGSITVDLAKRYPTAQVVGVEPSAGASALDVAREHASRLGLTNVTFEVADVHALERQYGSAAFDVIHAHQVLQHCGDGVGAMRQMRAILRPGGFAACRTADLASVSFYPADDPGMTAWQRLWLAVGTELGGEPRAGRMQHAWARQAGFTTITKTWGTQGWTTPEQVGASANSMAERTMRSGWADSVINTGKATREELETVATQLLRFGKMQDAWVGILNGEMLCFA